MGVTGANNSVKGSISFGKAKVLVTVSLPINVYSDLLIRVSVNGVYKSVF